MRIKRAGQQDLIGIFVPPTRSCLRPIYSNRRINIHTSGLSLIFKVSCRLNLYKFKDKSNFFSLDQKQNG